MSVFVSCGEASGDMYLGELCRRLVGMGLRVSGMGGPRCRAAGVDVLWDMGELEVLGFTEALGAVPRLLMLRERMARRIVQESPRCVVLTDSPDFHLPLARRLRRMGYRGGMVSLVPPAVWAWRSYRVRHLRELFDLCLPLFPFEHKFLLENRCRSAFVGHPLLEVINPLPVLDPAEGSCGCAVAFMPGSRGGEIRRHLEPFAQAALMVRREGHRPVFSLASSLGEEVFRWAVGVLDSLGLEWTRERGTDLMGRSCLAVMASGTVSLEALLLGRPGLVAYKTSGLTMALARFLVRSNWCALPNILLDRELYPELLQNRVRGDLLFQVIMDILGELGEPVGRSRWISAFEEGRRALGDAGAFDMWSRRVMEMAA